MKTCKSVPYGKPDAGNPHVRFDEGKVASEKPRRGSLLYNLPPKEKRYPWYGADYFDADIPYEEYLKL